MFASGSYTEIWVNPAAGDADSHVDAMNWKRPPAVELTFRAFGSPPDSHPMTERASSRRLGGK